MESRQGDTSATFSTFKVRGHIKVTHSTEALGAEVSKLLLSLGHCKCVAGEGRLHSWVCSNAGERDFVFIGGSGGFPALTTLKLIKNAIASHYQFCDVNRKWVEISFYGDFEVQGHQLTTPSRGLALSW